MRLLLDTHILMWSLLETSRLSRKVRDVLEDPENEILFSSASIWEIAIKAALGKPDFRVAPGAIFADAQTTGFIELPVTSAVAVKVAALPLHHRDPFDRLLVAQAMNEPAMFYTADVKLTAYSELVVHVG